MSECYGKRPAGFFRQHKAMLVCDSMRAHITEGSKEAVKLTNSIMAVIPGGTTKYLQPLDISVNRPFKIHIREEWEKWMSEGEKSFTKTGRMRKATFAQVTAWVKNAWNKVKIQTIVNGFVKAELIRPPTMDAPRDDPSQVQGTSSGACAREVENTSSESENEMDQEMLPASILQLFVSDTEESDFSGFHSSDME